MGEKWCPLCQVQLPAASVQCGRQPGGGRLDEVPLGQGRARRPRAAFSLSAGRPQSGTEAGRVAQPQGTAGSLSSSVCWCVRRETEARLSSCWTHSSQVTAGSVLCTIHHRKRTRWPATRPRHPTGPVHVPGGAALQRPLELVPRQVLPDGGLGAGCVSQFSPDHLRAG